MLSRVFPILVTLLSLSTAWAAAVKTDLQSYFLADAAYFNKILDWNGDLVESEPYTRFIGGLDFYTWPTENFMIQVNPELLSSTQLPQQPGFGEKEPKVGYVAYVEEGKGVWTYGDKERPKWRVALGWQYYKDNPHGRIFGDYLLRSMIYPNLVFTGFHKARTQVFGLRVENNIGDMFSHNFFITSETQRYPFYDISLAYSAGVKIGTMLEVGAGLNWVSAIPVRPSRTTPRGLEYYQIAANVYREAPFQDSTAIYQNGQFLKAIWIRPVSRDTGMIITYDTAGAPANPYDTTYVRLLNGKLSGTTEGALVEEGGYNMDILKVEQLCVQTNCNLGFYPELGGKEEQYSFAGQIFTARIAVNLLAHMGTMLGKDPFKVYAEAAVLGWKNYAGIYENRRERIPVMVGVNLPTFNALDFVALEVEYFPSKLAPTWRYRFMKGVPQPGGGPGSFDRTFADPDRKEKDDWKWGLIARKTFKGFAIAAQGGTDHMHSSTINENFHEIMSRPSHWYFMTRLILATGL